MKEQVLQYSSWAQTTYYDGNIRFSAFFSSRIDLRMMGATEFWSFSEIVGMFCINSPLFYAYEQSSAVSITFKETTSYFFFEIRCIVNVIYLFNTVGLRTLDFCVRFAKRESHNILYRYNNCDNDVYNLIQYLLHILLCYTVDVVNNKMYVSFVVSTSPLSHTVQFGTSVHYSLYTHYRHQTRGRIKPNAFPFMFLSIQKANIVVPLVAAKIYFYSIENR